MLFSPGGFTEWFQQTEEQTLPGPGTYDCRCRREPGRVYSRMEIRVENRAGPPTVEAPAAFDTAVLDADMVHWPMVLRTWKPGDRFRPLGLSGSKKLQDFFTDSKVPRSERGTVPLLCDQEKICWVVGYRLDDRVKTTAGTKRLLLVRLL